MSSWQQTRTPGTLSPLASVSRGSLLSSTADLYAPRPSAMFGKPGGMKQSGPDVAPRVAAGRGEDAMGVECKRGLIPEGSPVPRGVYQGVIALEAYGSGRVEREADVAADCGGSSKACHKRFRSSSQADEAI